MKQQFIRNRFLIAILTGLASMVSTSSTASTNNYRDTVLQTIVKVNDYWQSHNSYKTPAFWNWAAYHTGNMEVVKLLYNSKFKIQNSKFKVQSSKFKAQSSKYLAYSENWAKYNHWQGATEKDPTKWLYKKYGEDQQHVLFGDWQICFQTYIDMYNIKPQKKRIARALEVMSYEAESHAHDYWWWADALYMVMPVMTKMYKLTGEEKYLDKLYDNILYSDSIMLDTTTNLYFRDDKYVYPKHKTAAGKKDFWARGDGWVLAGLAKVLQDMPRDYKHYQFFVNKYQRLAEAIAALQQPEGYWTRSMMDPEQAPGPETSGTAFFTYGLLWGINNGYLSETEYMPMVSKAWTYLMHTALQPDGRIGYVQPIGEKAIPGQTIDRNSQADFGVGAFLLAACEYVRWIDNAGSKRQVAVTISNPSDLQQQGIAEVNIEELLKKLNIKSDTSFRLINAAGLEIDYQITHDGKLLIDASVQPHSSLTVYAETGKPRKPKYYVRGAQYKIRKDDIAWENDRCAYRVYGPALQRTGEKSFGIDVWVKSTPDLILDHRYAVDHQSNVDARPLENDGRKAEAKLAHNQGNFHLDHGNGFDGYGVGATLGCGTPALITSNDSLIMPYCYTSYKFLDNGPLRFTILLNYAANALGITEHRLITLDRGSHLNRIEVWYDGITKPMTFCAGVVLNGKGELYNGNNCIAYADPTDSPEVNGSQIYVATLFPNNDAIIGKTPDGKNAVGMIHNYTGQHIVYYAGAAWSRYDVPNFNIWKTIVKDNLKTLNHNDEYSLVNSLSLGNAQ